MKNSDQQKRKFNSYYEEKFINFYYKYLFHTGNIKDRLLDNFDDFEYAYSLSQSPGVPEQSRKYWEQMWSELLSKPIQSDYRPLYFSFQNTIHRKRFKSFEKFITFFYEEHEKILSRRNKNVLQQ